MTWGAGVTEEGFLCRSNTIQATNLLTTHLLLPVCWAECCACHQDPALELPNNEDPCGLT